MVFKCLVIRYLYFNSLFIFNYSLPIVEPDQFFCCFGNIISIKNSFVNTLTLKKLDLVATNAFPKLFLDYLSQNEQLQSFSSFFPDIEGFGKLLKQRNFSAEKRQILVKSLEKQYKNIEIKPDFEFLLNENTFTVTTGHQLNIFTGPLYIIYKIVTIINLAKALKEAYPAYNFVPVYWMATEDHDFAEIANFNLFGKTYQWETAQKGAVGRMNPKELKAILDEMPEKPSLFEEAYLQNNTLADAVRAYMHQLFGTYGLISLDGDDHELKTLFAPIIKDDLLTHRASEIVQKTSQELSDLGYKTQISPREINFFYVDTNLRERIVVEEGQYKVLNTDLAFSEAEILALLEKEPEKFSPNVVMRPLYQETILPNLAYIGGPSEVPYWLQLKDMFEAYQESFPLLMPRNFALIVNQASQKRADKLGITIEELFDDELTLRRRFVEQNSENSLNLAFEIDEIADIFQRITQKALAIDATLKAAVEAEKTKMQNGLENLEKRLKKAEERNQETAVNQLLALKNKLFPGGGLQERKENFLNFYLNNPNFIAQLIENLNPLEYKFNVLTEI